MEKTHLKDKNGKTICIGHTVTWDDGIEGIRTAKVVGSKEHIGFKCFKNSVPDNWAVGYTFNLGNFVYADTPNHLTIINSEVSLNSSHN